MLVLLFVSSLFGCAAIRAAVARQETLDRELSTYVIKQPLADAWKIATSDDRDLWELIAGKGLSWEETGKWQARSNVTTTTDKKNTGDIEITKVWYDVEGLQAGDGSQIHFFENTERHTIRNGSEGLADKSRNRNLEMELAFIKKLDPQGGAAIESKVQRAEQEARDE
jgi:hypothetical protein